MAVQVKKETGRFGGRIEEGSRIVELTWSRDVYHGVPDCCGATLLIRLPRRSAPRNKH